MYRESPTSLARLRLTRSTTKLRAHQLERFDQWKQLIGAALAERLGVEEVDVRVEALVAAALAAMGSASSRWAESDGAEDLIGLIDEAFGAIAGPFPELRGLNQPLSAFRSLLMLCVPLFIAVLGGRRDRGPAHLRADQQRQLAPRGGETAPVAGTAETQGTGQRGR